MNRYFTTNFSKMELSIALILIDKFINGINSMITEYKNLYNEDEIYQLKKIKNELKDTITNINNKEKEHIFQSIIKCLTYEAILKPYILKCWKNEYLKGSLVISWFKADKFKETPPVISASLSTKNKLNSFCDSKYGISYSYDDKAFLGACEKDAATLITDHGKSIYTIGETENKKVINSYNLATMVITPSMALNDENNDYPSKHNEIILDSRYIKPEKVIYLDDDVCDLVLIISKKYNIPMYKIEVLEKDKAI